jgi:hypothetical protein
MAAGGGCCSSCATLALWIRVDSWRGCLCYAQLIRLTAWRHVVMLYFCTENSYDHEVEALGKERAVLLMPLLLLPPVLLQAL